MIVILSFNNLNWINNYFTYQATKIWNSVELDVRKGKLPNPATSIKNK